MAQFAVRRLLDKSIKDYLVVEDHLFKTIRTTESDSRRAKYIYIQSEKLARVYREWLQDIFYNGERIRYIADDAETTESFRRLIETRKRALRSGG